MKIEVLQDNNKILVKSKKYKNYIYGSLFLLLSLILFISFFTYNENNISFNTISTKQTSTNIFSTFNSYLGDLIVQIFEFSIFTFIFSFFILGYKILFNKKTYTKKKQFISLIGLYISSSILFNNFSSDKYCFLKCGGVLGEFLTTFLYNVPLFLLNLLSISIFFISISFFLHIERRWWLYYSRKFYIYATLILKFILKYIKIMISFLMSDNLKIRIKKLFFRKKEIELETINNHLESERTIHQKSKLEKKNITNQNLDIIKNKYYLPNTLILNNHYENKNLISKEEMEKNKKKLMKVLNDYGIKGNLISDSKTGLKIGPVVTLYELEPEPGTVGSRVIGLANDIARSMSVLSARISSIPGKNLIGIELPNKERQTIYIKKILDSNEFKENKYTLPIIIGVDIAGEIVMADLSKMPHLLIAGTTGSGKSVGINTIITSLLYKFNPDECKFIMIDPKILELSVYDEIPHLLTPVITEPQKAVMALKWVCREMDKRYELLARFGVRNIESYNEKIKNYSPNEEEKIEKMPYIVVIVDEMADLMITAGKEINATIQRLAAKARASGIHLIMATQRPSVDVITGVIKANFPVRMSFSVVSSTDSQVILGSKGAEQLLGKGDMLYMEGGGKIKRVHGPFVSDEDVEKIVNFIINQQIPHKYIDIEEEMQEEKEISTINIGQKDLFGENKDKELYDQAVEIIQKSGNVSQGILQSNLGIGQPKAVRLLDLMEKNGVITPRDEKGRRKLIKKIIKGKYEIK